MTPLRIDFHLETPVKVPEYPIHLDGVLAWAAVQEGVLQGISMEEAQKHLPLEIARQDEHEVWKASWIDFSHGPRMAYPMSRPFEVQSIILDMGHAYKWKRRNKWDEYVDSGVNKAYLFTHPVRLSSMARAWCVGDKDQLNYLLNTWITHLGKLARLDMGRIKDITIMEDKRALDRWSWRTLPWPKENYISVYETTSPPYWKRENRQKAWIPDAMHIDFWKGD